MARWYIDRSKESANESELVAYKALSRLDDDWSVRWGYDFVTGATTREGDFLILGPDGCLLVLEVKRRARIYPRTGEADGPDQDRPEDQVQSQLSSTLKALQEKLAGNSTKYELSFIVPGLFSETGSGYSKRTQFQPFSHFEGKSSLEKLPSYWREVSVGGKPAKNVAKVRDLFYATFGDASPEAEARFLNATEKLLLERAAADFSLLDALGENRQLLVRGGPGSGKTWMAERHARRLAEAGHEVLFLCYNKALGHSLRSDITAASGKLAKGASAPRGRIDVHTWESLADLLSASLPPESLPPKPAAGASRETLLDYYERKLPEAMQEAVTAGTFRPLYDALIVDEAQDHNTDWWGIYIELLRERGGSPIGIYHDPAQRPAWRSGGFDLAEIAKGLSQPAHLRLLETRRYTRPLLDYLRSLESVETRDLIGGLSGDHLLAGPEIVAETHPNFEAAKGAAAKWLKTLLAEKLTDPADALLLTRSDPFQGGPKRDALFRDGESFAGCVLVPADAPEAGKKGNLRATSFNKAKGLDARTVLLLDTLPWEDLEPTYREPYWIAASRARQLLGVFPMKESITN
jgi:hypothetical protein